MLVLAQSDTTVGFLSKEPERINKAKRRPEFQAVIETLPDLRSLKKRIPPKHRPRVRRMRHTSFAISSAYAFRVIDPACRHHRLLSQMGALYSSSANVHNRSFDIDYAMKTADLIVSDERGLAEKKSSKILRLGLNRLRSLR